jgi:hypothetical protein
VVVELHRQERQGHTTDRSPQARDQLLCEGQVVVTPEHVGYPSAFLGAVLTLPGTSVRHGVSLPTRLVG